ncbi:hypothetical protein OC846_004784 [Tilletia horrida]|uniref:Protein kinase domain-containing protein n=1 Tax=Tilletia horrida TaxID=155126 RepID=A0AAN6JQ39_9BASI|nr:hypothetical protein OC846_004784 [Tilletia horrida]KAK0563094.1 hypothetical protein OC861_005001 [Tilletia horrida]
MAAHLSALSSSKGKGSETGNNGGMTKDTNAAGPSTSRLGVNVGPSSWRAAQHRGSVLDEHPMYSCEPEDYSLGREIGFGASSVVYEAKFKPLNATVAVKVIDLEVFGRDTDGLRRETQLMSLSKHPNVLRVRGCYLVGPKLHIATRFMAAGSMLDIMKFSHPDGFDEIVIATVLKQALQGLHYLHQNDWLHRDLKAANILVDSDGTVLLADFGVGVWLGESTPTSALSSESGGHEEGRKSFVGTPAWMAPEVVERKHYGVKADIWSFGITALELCQGRAPHARFAPVKALMKTLSDEPPQLDREGGAHRYSKVMEDFVRICLQKDPSKRPTAEKLLQHAFFKQARGPKFLVNAILAGLPPLSERQERRRKMSFSSMATAQSWDFGSVGVASGRGTPGTSTADRTDPFLGFSGIFGTAGQSAASPRGSVRSSKILSFDGQHAIAITPSHSQAPLNGGGASADQGNADKRSRSHSAAGGPVLNRRSRNRSNDSGFASLGAGGSFGPSGLRALSVHARGADLQHQRRSISREPSIDMISDSEEKAVKSRWSGSADSYGEVQQEGSAPTCSAGAPPTALEPIGEQKSPAALLPTGPSAATAMPALELPSSPFPAGEDPTPPASRAVSSTSTATATSKAMSSASSATTVATEPMSSSFRAAGTEQQQAPGDGPVPASLASSLEDARSGKPSFVASLHSISRTVSRSSQKNAPSSQQQPASSTGLFASRIRSRPGSSHQNRDGASSPSFSASAGANGEKEKGNGQGHRRTDSVLGKLFGRNSKK